MYAAMCIKAALRGAESLEAEWSVEEEAGFMLLADAVYCLQHLREAFSKGNG